jgi:hypothetical protein
MPAMQNIEAPIGKDKGLALGDKPVALGAHFLDGQNFGL